jgi:multidrug efflux pump subunit AcrB
MSAEPEAIVLNPTILANIWVRSDKGEMIPLSSLATVQYSAGPDLRPF